MALGPPGTVVFPLDDGKAVRDPGPHPDRLVAGTAGVRDGVVPPVPHDRGHGLPIAADRSDRAEVRGDAKAVLRGLGPHPGPPVRPARRDVAETEILALAPALEPGEVQDVLPPAGKTLALLPQVPVIRAGLFLGRPPVLLPPLGLPAHRGQRWAPFVRDGGEELVLLLHQRDLRPRGAPQAH